MRTFDKNNDGVIDKKELFDAFKYLMNTPTPFIIQKSDSYYPNNSDKNFHGQEFKKGHYPYSNHSQETYRPYRNTL